MVTAGGLHGQTVGLSDSCTVAWAGANAVAVASIDVGWDVDELDKRM